MGCIVTGLFLFKLKLHKHNKFSELEIRINIPKPPYEILTKAVCVWGSLLQDSLSKLSLERHPWLKNNRKIIIRNFYE